MGELLGSLTEVQSHHHYESFWYSIVDFMDVKTYDFSEFDFLTYRAQVRGGEYLNTRMISGLVVTDPAILELLKTRYEAFTRYQVAYFPTFAACKEWVEKTTSKPVLID